MNSMFHCVVGILTAVFFIWRYAETKYTYHLILTIWISSTFLVYISNNRTYSTVLGVSQLILLFLFLFFLRTSKKQRAQVEAFRQTQKERLEQMEKHRQTETGSHSPTEQEPADVNAKPE